MNQYWPSILLISGLVSAGCTHEPVDSESGDTEDTALPPDITGSVTYTYSESGESVCNLTAEFIGDFYPDFDPSATAFQITTSTITENEGTTEACSPNAAFLLDSESYAASDQQLLLVYWPDYSDDEYALAVVSLAGEDEDSLEYAFVAAAWWEDNSFSQQENSWDWTYSRESSAVDFANYHVTDACEETADGETNLDHLVVGAENIGTVIAGSNMNEAPTEEELHGNQDTWTFTANEGDLIQASVDTVNLEHWGHLDAFLNGPEECTLGWGYGDAAGCSFAPDSFSAGCPSFELEAPMTGTYSLIISSWPLTTEASREVDYSVVTLVEGEDATLRLASDNALNYLDSSLQVVGTATITEAE